MGRSLNLDTGDLVQSVVGYNVWVQGIPMICSSMARNSPKECES